MGRLCAILFVMFGTFVAQFKDFLHTISWSHPSWDLFVVVFFVVGALVYGFSLGRDRIIMIMVAVYMSLVAVTHLPFAPQIGAQISLSNGFVVRLSTFIGLFAILFFMLTRSALNHALSGGALGSWWHVLILSFVQVGMLISVVMGFLPSAILEKLTPFIRTVFVSPWGSFVWVVLPIVGLLLVGLSNERASNRYGR